MKFFKLFTTLVIASFFGLFSFNVYLYYTDNPWADPTFSVYKLGDKRPKWKVAFDMQQRGEDVVVSYHPNRMQSPFKTDTDFLLPLGGVSKVKTILCNETGEYLLFNSDRHGFNNPSDLWYPEPQILMVGDSFTQGVCPPSEKHMVSLIRNHYPKTINLGSVANGPLAMLAGIQEYVPFLRPKIVIWFYFEGNDIADLRSELSSPVLPKYLDPTFRQDLISRQPEIDLLVRDYIAKGIRSRVRKGMQEAHVRDHNIADFLLLRFLRHFFKRWFIEPTTMEKYDVGDDFKVLRDILRIAKNTVEENGGDLMVVYLPQINLPLRGLSIANHKEKVKKLVSELSLKFVDVKTEFQRYGDIKEFFYYPGSHYDERGYEIAGQTVIDALEHTKSISRNR